MVIRNFPPHESADETGLLAIGGDLDVDSLLLAYRSGIFPWPIDEHILTWFSPRERALLFLDEFHVPRSLKRAMRRVALECRLDTAFENVIRECSVYNNRRGQGGTWITEDIIAAYVELHRAGYAHSVEIFEENRLVGGLYGVSIGGMFAGESMFHRATNASKYALSWLVDHLRAQGVKWIDCQQMTPLLKSFGARLVPREDFLKLLTEATARPIKLFP